MANTCLTCRYHGPPISEEKNALRCRACLEELKAFSLWEPIQKADTGKRDMGKSTLKGRPDLVIVLEDGIIRGVFTDRPLLRGLDVAIMDYGVDLHTDDFVITDDGDVCAVYKETVQTIASDGVDEVEALREYFHDTVLMTDRVDGYDLLEEGGGADEGADELAILKAESALEEEAVAIARAEAAGSREPHTLETAEGSIPEM